MKYFSIVFIVLWRVCNVPEVVAKNRNLIFGNELFGNFPWNVLAETVHNGLDCFRGFVPLSEHGTSELKLPWTKLQYQNFTDKTGH